MYLLRPIYLLDTRTILQEAFLFNARLSARAFHYRKLRRMEVAGVCKTAETHKYYLLHVTGRHYTCVCRYHVRQAQKCKSQDHGIQHALMNTYHTFCVRSASFPFFRD